MNNPHHLSLFSQRMATLTMCFAVAIVGCNIAAWVFPFFTSWGWQLSWSSQLISSLNQNSANFPWWQRAGGIFISSIPLIALVSGLLNLQALFKIYSKGEYFSYPSVIYLKKLSHALLLWVFLSFLCEPLLSVWITVQEPIGNRCLSLSCDASSIIALFLSACTAVIARILGLANEMNAENQQFV